MSTAQTTPTKPQSIMDKARAAVPMVTASIISGIVTRIVLHPVDTIKSQVQAYSNSMTFRELLAQQGIRNLYSGFFATCCVSVPGVITYFGAYEASKKELHKIFGIPESETSHLINLTSGLIAEAISCVFWVPGDVIKERMQIQQLKNTSLTMHYRSPLHILQDAYQKQGLWRGVYKGYAATLFSFGPYSALYLTFYEILRKKMSQVFNVEQPTLPMCFVAGGVAGAGAAFVTAPLDLIKVRLQVQRAAERAAMGDMTGHGTTMPTTTTTPKYLIDYKYNNTLDGLKVIWREGGVRGLFKGGAARMAFTAPAAAITISLFDTIRAHTEKLMNADDNAGGNLKI